MNQGPPGPKPEWSPLDFIKVNNWAQQHFEKLLEAYCLAYSVNCLARRKLCLWNWPQVSHKDRTIKINKFECCSTPCLETLGSISCNICPTFGPYSRTCWLLKKLNICERWIFINMCSKASSKKLTKKLTPALSEASIPLSSCPWDEHNCTNSIIFSFVLSVLFFLCLISYSFFLTHSLFLP